MGFKALRANLLVALLSFAVSFPLLPAWADVPVEMDLTSTSATAQAPGTGTIIVDGQSRTIQANSPITFAEYVALTQVLGGGQQTLTIGSGGAATSGSLLLNQVVTPASAGLVIPQGVTVMNDFSSNSTLTLAGTLNNAGNFYALSTNPTSTVANISASNIINQSGALLSSVLPTGGIAGFANAIANLSLNLNSANNIINSGTISSAANLSMIAQNTISNTVGATISAVNNLNMQAASIINQGAIMSQLGSLTIATSTLTNSSTISAMSGNVVINNLMGSDLSILNQGGVINAKGDIIAEIINDSGAKPNLDIVGGSLLSANTNIANSTGKASIAVQDISGVLNVSACSLDLSVTGGTSGLTIGSLDVTGDPNLVFNGPGPFVSPAFASLGGFVDITSTGAGGSITFTGPITTAPAAAGPGGYVSLNAATTVSTQSIDTTGTAGGASGLITITAGSGVSTGQLISPGQTATVTSAAGTIDIASPGAWNLGTTSLSVGAPGGSTVQATAGNLTLGTGTITNTSTSQLTVQAPAGTVDLTAPIAAATTAISSAGPVLITGNAVDLSSAGTLIINSSGTLGTGFLAGVNLVAGAGGIIFPGGGSNLTINFQGAGGELIDNAAAGFAGLNGTNLTINSAGDIHFQSNTFDNVGGSINMTVPSSSFFINEFDILGVGQSRFSNISTSGGPMGIFTNGSVQLNNTILNTTPSVPGGGGLAVVSGAGCVACPNTQTGISVMPGATVSAIQNFLLLAVFGTQTSPPANPAIPVISVGAGSTVQSTGAWSGTTPLGGVVQISVNTSPPPPGLFATLQAIRPSEQLTTSGGGYIQTIPGGVTYSATSNSTTFGASGTVTATGDGMVMLENTVPGLIQGVGAINTAGGLIYVGGASYVGEIVINGTVFSSLPFIPFAAPVVPPVLAGPAPVAGVGPIFAALNIPNLNNITALVEGPTIGLLNVSEAPTTLRNTAISNLAQQYSNMTRMPESGLLYAFACQQFSLCSNKDCKDPSAEGFVVAGAGSVIDASGRDKDPNSFGFERGKMMVFAGKSNVSVRVKQGTVELPANSASIIEEDDHGRVMLSSIDGEAASFKIPLGNDGKDRVLQVKPGEQVAVSDAEDELLIPTDVAVEVEARMVVQSKVAEKRTFNREEMIRKEKLLLCVYSDDADDASRQVREKVRDLRKRLTNAAPEPSAGSVAPAAAPLKKSSIYDGRPMASLPLLPEDALSAQSDLRPVAFAAPAMTRSGGPIRSLTTDKVLIKSSANADIDLKSNPGAILLKSGEMVLSSFQPVLVKAGTCIVSVPAGTIVHIERSGAAVKVHDVWEVRPDSVQVVLGNKLVRLAAGKEIVTDFTGSPLDIFQADEIGRRNLQSFGSATLQKLAVADVSLHSLLRKSELLHQMVKSEDREDQQISNKIIKMAAILNLVQASGGPYSKVGSK